MASASARPGPCAPGCESSTPRATPPASWAPCAAPTTFASRSPDTSERDAPMADELKVSSLNRRFVGFIASHPWWAILLGLGIMGVLAAGMGRLRADFTHAGFFWDTDPKLKRFEAFERRFGNDETIVIAV